jgi:hypothetical protein
MKTHLTHRARMMAIVFIAGALASCSSDGTNTSGGTGCSFTLSGALTGTPACTPLGTFWTSDDNKTAFGFTPNFSGDPAILVTIATAGQAATGTYHETDVGAVAAISVSSTNGNQWAMQTADGGTPASGSYTLTFSSVSTVTSDAATKVYQVHGTLTATLPAVAGTSATGTVTLRATF